MAVPVDLGLQVSIPIGLGLQVSLPVDSRVYVSIPAESGAVRLFGHGPAAVDSCSLGSTDVSS